MGLLVARTAAQVVDFFSLVEWPGPLRSRLISVKSGTCVCAMMTLQGKRYIHWAPTQSLCMIHATWNQSERRVVCMDGCMDGCMDRCLSIMAPIAFFNIPGRNIKISSLVFKGLLSCPMDWAWAFHKYMACKAL